jgi:hypothetical protein
MLFQFVNRVIQRMNRPRYSKKTGLLRKFKSETFDQYDSNVKQYIKTLIFNETIGYPYHLK